MKYPSREGAENRLLRPVHSQIDAFGVSGVHTTVHIRSQVYLQGPDTATLNVLAGLQQHRAGDFRRVRNERCSTASSGNERIGTRTGANFRFVGGVSSSHLKQQRHRPIKFNGWPAADTRRRCTAVEALVAARRRARGGSPQDACSIAKPAHSTDCKRPVVS
jgi:hypothetical protein